MIARTDPYVVAFTTGYLECAAWADGSPDQHEPQIPSGEWAADALEAAIAECWVFVRRNWAALSVWADAGIDARYAGNDFWLTRNGHGTGYWDRDVACAEWALEALTAASRACGESTLLVDDDGRYSVEP